MSVQYKKGQAQLKYVYVVFFAIGLLGGCATPQPPSPSNVSRQTNTVAPQRTMLVDSPEGAFRFSSVRLTGESTQQKLTGRVKNTTTKEWNAVTFQLVVFDSANVKLATKNFSFPRLAPGETKPIGMVSSIGVTFALPRKASPSSFEIHYISGQTPARARYSSALVEIDRPQATTERHGAVITLKPELENKYLYEDALFSGLFFVTESRINFTITNKTDHSIRIIWDEATFIDLDAQSGRLLHDGVRYADRNLSQPPSVIAGGTSLSDFALPTERLRYREDLSPDIRAIIGDWEELPLVRPTLVWVAAGNQTKVDAFASEVSKNRGKRFGLLLPLAIEGIVNEYTFWFEVQEASIVR